MSLYSIDFIKSFEQAMVSDGRPAPVDWVEGGYLFIVPPDNVANLERNVRRQRAEGCVVDLLTPQELKAKFPSMNVDDLGAGAHTPHDGWCDPNGLLWGFRRKAVELGAVYVKDRVVAAEMERRWFEPSCSRVESALRPMPSSTPPAPGPAKSRRCS